MANVHRVGRTTCRASGRWEDLPETLRAFVGFVDADSGARVGWVSTGPERSRDAAASAASMQLQRVRHVAVIMDGNGRWANERGEERRRGHAAGVNAVRDIVTECARAKLPWLSLYALSTERPSGSAALRSSCGCMVLLKKFLIDERPTLMENDVRLRSTGRIDELPGAVVKELRKTEALTAGNRGMTLVLALNYRRAARDRRRRAGHRREGGRRNPRGDKGGRGACPDVGRPPIAGTSAAAALA
jgi:hypothetical protein